MIGNKYSKWTVLEELKPLKYKFYQNDIGLRVVNIPMVKCQCECGRIKEVRVHNLIHNISKQCRSCSNRQQQLNKKKCQITE